MASALDFLVDDHGDSNQIPESTGILRQATGSFDTILEERESEPDAALATPSKQARRHCVFNRANSVCMSLKKPFNITMEDGQMVRKNSSSSLESSFQCLPHEYTEHFLVPGQRSEPVAALEDSA